MTHPCASTQGYYPPTRSPARKGKDPSLPVVAHGAESATAEFQEIISVFQLGHAQPDVLTRSREIRECSIGLELAPSQRTAIPKNPSRLCVNPIGHSHFNILQS
jgi:hypothetical protein